MNAMGVALEDYIKNLFAGTLRETNQTKRKKGWEEVFSYLGNQNNPPDLILKGADAIEVKKMERPTSMLALNSSYPKNKLYSSNPMITKACRECEDEPWDVKDILYVIGILPKKELRALAMVYGIDFCDDVSVYERVRSNIKDGVEHIEGIEFSETKELGRVNKVDHLGITSLRVRGMWSIQSPFELFKDYYELDLSKRFSLMAIINEEKLSEFDSYKELEELAKGLSALDIQSINIQDPQNPAKLKRAKLVSYYIE